MFVVYLLYTLLPCFSLDLPAILIYTRLLWITLTLWFTRWMNYYHHSQWSLLFTCKRLFTHLTLPPYTPYTPYPYTLSRTPPPTLQPLTPNPSGNNQNPNPHIPQTLGNHRPLLHPRPHRRQSLRQPPPSLEGKIQIRPINSNALVLWETEDHCGVEGID